MNYIAMPRPELHRTCRRRDSADVKRGRSSPHTATTTEQVAQSVMQWPGQLVERCRVASFVRCTFFPLAMSATPRHQPVSEGLPTRGLMNICVNALVAEPPTRASPSGWLACPVIAETRIRHRVTEQITAFGWLTPPGLPARPRMHCAGLWAVESSRRV